jgi:hypothetical protein
MKGVLDSQIFFLSVFIVKIFYQVFMLIIVFFDDLLKTFNVFIKRCPLFIQFFKPIFYKDSGMLFMFSINGNTILTEKLLVMVYAFFIIAKEHLDASTLAVAFYIVNIAPILVYRCLILHLFMKNDCLLLVSLN